MTITNTIKMDLLRSGPSTTIEAVQGDSFSRSLEFRLYAAGAPFAVPEHTRAIIRYVKADRTGGEYDTLPDGTPAWSLSRNAVTVILAPQVLTFPGKVDLSVTLICGEQMLTTFPVCLQVQPSAHAPTAESQDFFYVTGFLPAPVAAQTGDLLRVCAVNSQGIVTAMEAVPAESITGSADAEQVIELVEEYLTQNPPQAEPGEDGISATHIWDGTVLTVTSASGTSSADLKGDTGEPGASGEAGKSAYETALDGGYLGTEEEFAAKLAVDFIDWFGKGISISDGDDLDTYKTNGKYYCQSESRAQSLSNCPTTTNFVMFVFLRTSNVYSQLIITLSGKMYIRSSSTSAWRAWVAYTTSEEIAELTQTVKQELSQEIEAAKANGDFNGADGYTPVRGVDYWTEADQEAIVQQVIDALGTPVFGTVDEDNTITLSGGLAGGTYTVKYEHADGSLTTIGTLDAASGSISYTNQLPIATDSDGSVYNTVGYKSDVRWSNSAGAEVAYTGCYLSGYIPVSAGDIIRLKNVEMLQDTDGNLSAIFFFSDYGVSAGYVNCETNIDTVSPVWEDGNLTQFTAAYSGYFRISTSYLGEDSIITVNEVIG